MAAASESLEACSLLELLEDQESLAAYDVDKLAFLNLDQQSHAVEELDATSKAIEE
jgi:hypothetical protein